MWKKPISLQQLNQLSEHSAVSHLGIEFTAKGEDYLEASLSVDHRTTQPFGLLHGGIAAALAETVGSAAALLSAEATLVPVGIELNISHLRAVREGKVTARATPLHLGNRQQVWQIELFDQHSHRCSAARLSVRLVEQS